MKTGATPRVGLLSLVTQSCAGLRNHPRSIRRLTSTSLRGARFSAMHISWQKIERRPASLRHLSWCSLHRGQFGCSTPTVTDVLPRLHAIAPSPRNP